MDLYNCKIEINRDDTVSYRITKFTRDIEPIATYQLTPETCDCPASYRPGPCKHRRMLAKFLSSAMVNTHLFLDPASGRWLDANLHEVAQPSLVEIIPASGAPTTVPIFARRF